MEQLKKVRTTLNKSCYSLQNTGLIIDSFLWKVDFFWINRDQVSFEWFIYLLNELELEQAEKGGEMERFLDLHLYMTAMKDYASLEAFGLQMALDSVYKMVNL